MCGCRYCGTIGKQKLANYCYKCGERYPGLRPLISSYRKRYGFRLTEFIEDFAELIDGALFCKVYEAAFIFAVLLFSCIALGIF